MEVSPETAEVAETEAPPGLVEVRLEDFAFYAPAKLASGWTTFRMTNEGEQPHFMIFWKLPEGVEFEDFGEVELPGMDKKIKAYRILDRKT